MGHAVGLQEKVASNFVVYMDFMGICGAPQKGRRIRYGCAGLSVCIHEPLDHSTSPYLTLMRSSFSSIGSANNSRKITVAQA